MSTPTDLPGADQAPTGTAGSPGLVDRQVGFVNALRGAGVPVSAAESVDAARVMGTVDLLHREQLRAGLAATLVKRAVYRPTFDRLFDLWWPPAVGDPIGTASGDDGDGDEPGHGNEPLDPEALEQLRRVMRDQLREVLLDGDDEAIRRFARQAVGVLGKAPGGAAGRAGWFSYRVMRALNPDTLMASMLAAILQGQDRGGLAERSARQLLTERIKAFTEAVEDEVRRRLAEERGVEAIARTAVKPLVDQVDFLRASRDDMAALRREVYPLARRLATRLTARRRLGRAGRLDIRRTVRASLSSGGVPLTTVHRPQKPHKPELVVLCDV